MVEVPIKSRKEAKKIFPDFIVGNPNINSPPDLPIF